MDKYSDRIIENIKDFESILCKKCKFRWYPELVDVKNKSVYYLRCLSCRISNNKAVRKHRSLKI